MWQQVRVPVIVPLLRASVAVCLAMCVILFVEKVYMAVVITAVRLLGRRPERQWRWEPMREDDDPELGSAAYPMVLVQIPMYNEREVRTELSCTLSLAAAAMQCNDKSVTRRSLVTPYLICAAELQVYQLSIGAACGLSWPSDRIVIQVLDDSTDPVIKEMVQMECQRWARKGVNIKYEIRDNRRGYKAGALKEGMKHGYVRDCDFVAIFDADFQPEPNFLCRAMPFFIHNPEIALVQGRWRFVNADECLMTRMQEMSLDYHFKVEQEVGSSAYAFFGFNGTAGVWRISALNEAGGWKDRTTVEDMDLAVRASLKGWKFVYLGDLMKVTLRKRIYVIYNFFFVRKIIGHILTSVFYCFVIPATVFVPEIEIPRWGYVYIPTIITLLNAVGTPR
ncbi:hypothetical protein ACQ4PT_005147 [Festuca glaucescens]